MGNEIFTNLVTANKTFFIDKQVETALITDKQIASAELLNALRGHLGEKNPNEIKLMSDMPKTVELSEMKVLKKFLKRQII